MENESERGTCADCGGAGVIEVESADEHRDFRPCRCVTDPTAGERPVCYSCGPGYRLGDEGCRHTPAEPDAGDVEALADALAPELYVALMEVTTNSWRLWRYLTDEAKEKHRQHAAQIVADGLSDWLAAHDAAVRRKAADDRAEQIAQAIEAHRRTVLGNLDIRVGLDRAARIARARTEAAS